MLGFVYTSTLKDFMRAKRLVAWAVLAIVIGLMGRIWVTLGSSGTEVQTYGFLATVIVYRFMALVAAIFSTMVLSQEVEQKTIVYLLTRTVPRGTMLLGRTLACWTAVTLVSWVTAVCAGIGALGFGFLSNGAWWFDLVILAVGAAAYSTFFTFVSLLVQKAMVFSLLFAFGWETFVPNMPGDLNYVSIYSYLNQMSAHAKHAGLMPVLDALSGAMNENPVTPWGAALILGIASTVLMAAGMVWFSKFEYLPREEGS